jgi:hypothetical protein
MPFGKIIAIYSENNMKPIYTLFGQNVELLKQIVYNLIKGLYVTNPLKPKLI